eukprot:TRINITY_DN1389_c0_g2_i1.p1 TRINITY_DN1389_c0_g2~~TRINITY_DN1389_c0_g2_i1.p1  ORF type:complete len:165 (-),score=31.44 TRINITY_DN1389_c0_g2_i1:261-755(-)
MDAIAQSVVNLYRAPVGNQREWTDSFQRYAPNATFDDPFVSVKGVDNIYAQFLSLAYIFDRIHVREYQAFANHAKSRLSIDMVVDFYFKILFFQFCISLRILTICILNAEGKIISHTDHWDIRSMIQNFPILSHIYEGARVLLGILSSALILAFLGQRPRQTIY